MKTYNKISIVSAILGILMVATIGIAGAIPVEEWQKTYGQSEADSVHQTSDGGYIFAGIYSLGITKVDSKGNLQWNKISGYHTIDSVMQTKDGGYIVVGDDNLYHIWLIKTGSTGTVQWKKDLDLGSGSVGSDSVHQTSDGGYILAYTNSNNVGVVTKTDQSGIVQWSKSYGYIQGTPYGYPYSALQTTDGGYIVAGEDEGYPWLVKIDSKGNEQWSKSYNYGMDWGAFSVQPTKDGGYIFSAKGTTNRAVVKVDSKGNEQWNKRQDDNNSFNAVMQTNDGGYILAGFTSDSIDTYAIVTKIDSKGNEQWRKPFSQKDSYGSSIQQTTDGGYILAGGLGQNALLVKFSADSPKSTTMSTLVVSPILGQQDTIFQFTGSDLTPTADIDLHILEPNGTEYIVKNLLADSSGKISYQYIGTCANLVGSYTAWVVDRVTDIKSNNITFTISTSPSCATPAPDILTYYRELGQSPSIVETNDLLKAADDWRNNIIPQEFSISISTGQLLTLADEWRNS